MFGRMVMLLNDQVSQRMNKFPCCNVIQNGKWNACLHLFLHLLLVPQHWSSTAWACVCAEIVFVHRRCTILIRADDKNIAYNARIHGGHHRKKQVMHGTQHLIRYARGGSFRIVCRGVELFPRVQSESDTITRVKALASKPDISRIVPLRQYEVYGTLFWSHRWIVRFLSIG